ncbi:MAG: LptE family protein [Candidatus Zixiibacteriota bacterium]|nr:MAG: LptE family protein [candidate division Zixibacteria bacterium]
MTRYLSILTTGIVTASLLSGCGIYTLNPKGKSDIKTIGIEPFENNTAEFGLADRLTEIIIDAFIADGNLKVVSVDEADAVLVGTLLSYDRVPDTYDANDQVQSYKVIMNVEIQLQKPSDGSEYWKETTRQEGVYHPGADQPPRTEEDGQQLAGERLVEAIIDRTTKSW